MIRPIDLQNTILQSMQGAAGTQRAEEGPRLAAQAAQAQFIARSTERDESVAPADEASGARIGDKPPEEHDARDGSDKRRASSQSTFEEVVDDAASAADAPHLIDVSA